MFRNLTREYRLLREGYSSKQQHLSGNSSFDNGGFVKLSDEANKINSNNNKDNSNLPPVWVDFVEDIEAIIKDVTIKMNSFETLRTEVKRFDDKQEEIRNAKLDELSLKITKKWED